MPNQATATAPRTRLAICAPLMPKLMRLMTGNGTPVFSPMNPEKFSEAEQEDGADAQRHQDLPAAQTKGEQADGEGVVTQAVDVVGPEGKDAVAGPLAAFGLGGGKVDVVKTGADGTA